MRQQRHGMSLLQQLSRFALQQLVVLRINLYLDLCYISFKGGVYMGLVWWVIVVAVIIIAGGYFSSRKRPK
ncbi:hypothetical protein [Paenibacillus sp. PL2-23]|uniref:hypothetical protein n=1 Tax=Paenibacillus sp. PL2-23 TaxID=2100729 RepID=UPI0030FCB7AB